MSPVDANKDLVRRFMAAFSVADYPTVLAMMDDDATWWVGGTTPLSGTHTKAAFANLLDGVGEILTGPIVLTPKEFTAEGNRVAVETESLAHTRNGRTYNNHYHFVFELRGDKVLRVKEYLDTMHAYDVLCRP